MAHLGEIISLVVAVSWTATALFADEASHRLGSMTVNVIRLVLASVFLGVLLWVTVGRPWPVYAGGQAWLWLAMSALVGYVFGDFCLFNSYLVIGARMGQLFMTLAPVFAAIAGRVLLGESLRPTSWLAIGVTLSGIAISILSKGSGGGVRLSLPIKGVLLGIGAGLGQGVGLVLSKVGLEHYGASVPPDAPSAMEVMMPFAGTMIRALVGGTGFLLIMALRRELPRLAAARKDRRGMRAAVLTTVFGPTLGVSLSLMAVQYAEAGIASTLMALTPVLIIAPYALIHKERIRPREVLGVIVSLVGVSMFFLL